MTNSSRPAAEMPTDLPIPTNLTYVVTSSQTAPDKWMAECCEPNPVHVVRYCWEWCEVSGKDGASISEAFGHCMIASGRNLNTSNGLLVHMSGAVTYDAFTGSTLMLSVLLLSLLKPFF